MSRVAALAALLAVGLTSVDGASVVPIANAEPAVSAKATPLEKERKEELHRLMQLMGTQTERSFSCLADTKPLTANELRDISRATRTVEWASRLLKHHPIENQARVAKLGEIAKSFRKSIGEDYYTAEVVPADQERAVRASLSELKSVCHQCHVQARAEDRLHDYNEVTPP